MIQITIGRPDEDVLSLDLYADDVQKATSGFDLNFVLVV